MASRYGSMKQTEGFGPSGETIMDYSIYDAIRAGFGKVVFIIRKDFAEGFKASFEPKLQGKIKTEYVYQEMDSYLDGLEIPAGRTKPWGTAHAVLCGKNVINEPFAIINADDYYGKDAFIKAYDFIVNGYNDRTMAVLGYELANTLSENGSVSRGVISVNNSGEMAGITERLKIYRKDGVMVFEDNDTLTELPESTKVSMNFFVFGPPYIDMCDDEFGKFLDNNMNNPKAEFLIPTMADYFIKSGRGVIQMIPTSAKWFGVTYKEDAPVVQANIDALVNAGEYPNNLWG